MKEACKKLEEKYSEYGRIKVRGNNMSEFVLKKIPSKIEEIKEIKDIKENDKIKTKTNRSNKVKNNKTRKNR